MAFSDEAGSAAPVAVVTGAGRMRSIGRAVAVELARVGHDVVVVGNGRGSLQRADAEREARRREIEAVADEVRALGRQATVATVDIADEASVDALFTAVRDRFGRVDVVVNNAAAARGADRVPITELVPAAFDEVLAVNVRGTYLMTAAAARRIVAQGGGGAIVNISSIAGKLGTPGAAAYAASKAAVQSLTVSAARELADHDIRVNAVCPGIVTTDRLADTSSAQWDRTVAARVPLGRAGDPEDIGRLVAYLAGDGGRWVTGQCWNVDGGQLTVR